MKGIFDLLDVNFVHVREVPLTGRSVDDVAGHIPLDLLPSLDPRHHGARLARLLSSGMDVDRIPFGVLLRRWRERRRITQETLALAANSSTRHLSCLETGRSQPSREMVAHLAEHLEVPLRDRNALLLAAGFAPTFQERPLAELDAARRAIEQVLQAHKPYPAFALDRHWNVVLSNSALPQLYEGCSPELLRKPVNAIRLILHPSGVGPRLVNFNEWRAHVVTVLRQQIESRPDPHTQALLAEIMTYPSEAPGKSPLRRDGAQRYATPLQIATRLGTVSFLSTTTIFGTPTDVTLSELALEMLFPADEQTVAIVKAMVQEGDAMVPNDGDRLRTG